MGVLKFLTPNVSASGGLLSLSSDVAPSQEFLVANTQIDEDLRSRIARTIRTPAGTTLVGFEFLRPRPALLVYRLQVLTLARPEGPTPAV